MFKSRLNLEAWQVLCVRVMIRFVASQDVGFTILTQTLSNNNGQACRKRSRQSQGRNALKALVVARVAELCVCLPNDCAKHCPGGCGEEASSHYRGAPDGMERRLQYKRQPTCKGLLMLGTSKT